jgi:hypothetical protein
MRAPESLGDVRCAERRELVLTSLADDGSLE